MVSSKQANALIIMFIVTKWEKLLADYVQVQLDQSGQLCAKKITLNLTLTITLDLWKAANIPSAPYLVICQRVCVR